jgi:serine/threonine-protein kinase RsbT
MPPLEPRTFAIRTAADVVFVRQTARAWAIALRLSVTDQTKIATAASELARNALQHGGGGLVTFEAIRTLQNSGLRLTFNDQGPGIPDVAAALQDGYTTAKGLGLGLGGAKRLVDDFIIESQPGQGTRVVITQWT